jgi:hypothetical protein
MHDATSVFSDASEKFIGGLWGAEGFSFPAPDGNFIIYELEAFAAL